MDGKNLRSIWWNDPHGGSYTVGQNAKELVLKCDGHGLNGYYDRIHLTAYDGSRTIFPAHHVHGWTEIEGHTPGHNGDGSPEGDKP